MNGTQAIISVIKSLVSESITAVKKPEIVPLKLLTIKPLTLQKSRELILDEDDVIIPKGLYFSKADIGKTFSFVSAHDGQRYCLLHSRGSG